MNVLGMVGELVVVRAVVLQLVVLFVGIRMEERKGCTCIA